MSREAFEKWWDGYDLTKNNTVSSTTVLELLYAAWQARGEHDAKIIEQSCQSCGGSGARQISDDECEQCEFCNVVTFPLAKAIREGDVCVIGKK